MGINFNLSLKIALAKKNSRLGLSNSEGGKGVRKLNKTVFLQPHQRYLGRGGNMSYEFPAVNGISSATARKLD